MNFRFQTLATALALLTIAGPAQAAVVVRNYAFSAGNFFQSASPPPVPVVTGSFTVTFDDALPVTDATAGLKINSLNIPVGSPITYSYELGDFGFIRFGGLQSGSGNLALGTNDILFQFSERFGGVLFYTSTLTPTSSYFTTSVAVTVTNAAVPEPATWALMMVGFAGIGASLRGAKRRKLIFA